MEFNLEDMLNKVLDQLKTFAKTETVIGEPFVLGEFTCVPVVKIGMGFGSGAAGSTEADKKGGKGGGSGAGIGLEPIGFLVSRGSEISMVSVNRSKGLDSIFEKVPDLIERLVNSKKEGKKEKEK